MGQTASALVGYGLDLTTADRIERSGMRMPAIRASTDDALNALGILPHVIGAIRDSVRTPIPPDTVVRVLRAAAFACCICTDRRRSVVIHHIRRFSESRDHSEDNLVVLCLDHHGEAHTRRELSLNLTPERLLSSKTSWLAEVQARKEETLDAAPPPIQEQEAKEHYLPFVSDDDICPGCGEGHLRWLHWGRSPFGAFSAWFTCSHCNDMTASGEQFGD